MARVAGEGPEPATPGLRADGRNAIEAPAESMTGARALRVRSIFAVILVVLSTLGVVLTPAAWWIRTTLFDTPSFMAVVRPTLSSEEVTVVVGDLVANEVIETLDISGRLENRLGAVDRFLAEGLVDALELGPVARRALGGLDIPSIADLAAPVAAAAEAEIRDASLAIVRSDAIQATLPAAVERAHLAAVALIGGDEDALVNVLIVDGEVRWSLVSTVAAVVARVADEGLVGGVIDRAEVPRFPAGTSDSDIVAALASALGGALPDDFGQVVIMSEDSLRRWQQLARTLDRGVWGLTILTGLFIAGALAVSVRRRRTLVQLALGAVAGLLLFGILRRNITDALEDAVAAPEQSAAVGLIADELFAGLQAIGLAVLAVALITGLVAHLLGRPAWLRRLRHAARRVASGSNLTPGDMFVVEHRDGLIAAGLVTALGTWWVFGVGLVSVIVVGTLLGVYLFYLSIVHRGDRTMAKPGD